MRKHGGKGTPTYGTWLAMMARCYNKNHRGFRYCGGRGIGVCDRWRDFSAFLEDMGERPNGMTIDRIDNSKGYEPGNCRWATNAEQQRNRRNTKLTPSAVIKIRAATGRGSCQALADEFGVSVHYIYNVRCGNKWPGEVSHE